MSDRLAALEALVDAATPGPWEYAETEDGRAVVRSYQEDGTALVVCKADWGTFGDAALIAAAPTALRDFLAAVRALRDAEESLSRLPDYPHQPNCGDWDAACATCYGLMVRDDLRAALANLEGGAS